MPMQGMKFCSLLNMWLLHYTWGYTNWQFQPALLIYEYTCLFNAYCSMCCIWWERTFSGYEDATMNMPQSLHWYIQRASLLHPQSKCYIQGCIVISIQNLWALQMPLAVLKIFQVFYNLCQNRLFFKIRKKTCNDFQMWFYQKAIVPKTTSLCLSHIIFETHRHTPL